MNSQDSFTDAASGRLYLVPTPIGNLDDMTFRAVKTLREVNVIAAEDTRHTQQLLNRFEITTKQVSFHEHNTAQRIPELIARLKKGDSVAQVSDAGMPSISDPGKELVETAIAEQIQVVPLPGANAGLTALIASGISPQPFLFYGFLPRKKNLQIKEFERLRSRSETLIFYESPYRVIKTLKNMQDMFGNDRQIALGRELTKKHEQFLRGTLASISAWFDQHEPRGEFVMIVAGNAHPVDISKDHSETKPPLSVAVQQLVDDGYRPTEAIKQVAKQRGISRQVVYQQYHHL